MICKNHIYPLGSIKIKHEEKENFGEPTCLIWQAARNQTFE
jgi:hypothetical protein